MNISIETEKMIEEINDFSERPIKNKYEVSVIFESVFNSDKKLFRDLIFNAKYVNGLQNVLSGRSINKDDYMKKLFEEFNRILERFIILLKQSVINSGEQHIKFFDEKYFKLTQESMANVLGIIEDLTLVKEYFNSKPKGVLD